MKQLFLRFVLTALLVFGECGGRLPQHNYLSPPTILHSQDVELETFFEEGDPEPAISRRARSFSGTRYLWIGIVLVPLLFALGCKNLYANNQDRAAGVAISDLDFELEEKMKGLIRELAHKNKNIRVVAAKALGEMGPKASFAVSDLIKALRDSNGQVRVDAAKALGAIGPKASFAVPALIEAFDDRSDEVRLAVVYTLGAIGSKASSVIPTLIKALGDSNSRVQFMAVGALNAIAPKDSRAVPALIKILNQKNCYGNFCISVIDALGRIGPSASSAIPILIKELKSTGMYSYPGYAAVALERIGPKSIPYLIKVANNTKKWSVQRHAVEVLAGLGSKAIPALTQELKGSDPKSHVIAIYAFAMMDPKDLSTAPISVIVNVLDNPDANARNNTLRVLSRMGPRAAPAVSKIIKLIEDPNERVSAWAVYALGEIGPKSSPAIPAIIKYCAMHNYSVGSEAFNALEKIDERFDGLKLEKLIKAKYFKYYFRYYLSVEVLFKSLMSEERDTFDLILPQLNKALNLSELYLLLREVNLKLEDYQGIDELGLFPEDKEIRERLQLMAKRLTDIGGPEKDFFEPPKYSGFNQFFDVYQKGRRGVLASLVMALVDRVESGGSAYKAEYLLSRLVETGVLTNFSLTKGVRESRDLGLYLSRVKGSGFKNIAWNISVMPIPDTSMHVDPFWDPKQTIHVFGVPKKTRIEVAFIQFLRESNIENILNYIRYGELYGFKLSKEDLTRFNKYPGAKSFLSMLFLYDPPTWIRKFTISGRVYRFLEEMLSIDPEFTLQWVQLRLKESEVSPEPLYFNDLENAIRFTQKMIIWFSKNPEKLNSMYSFDRIKEVFRLYQEGDFVDPKYLKIIKELEKKIAEEEKKRKEKVLKVGSRLLNSANEMIRYGAFHIGGGSKWGANALFSKAYSFGTGLNWKRWVQPGLTFIRIPELLFALMVFGMAVALGGALMSLTTILLTITLARISELKSDWFHTRENLLDLFKPKSNVLPSPFPGSLIRIPSIPQSIESAL